VRSSLSRPGLADIGSWLPQFPAGLGGTRSCRRISSSWFAQGSIAGVLAVSAIGAAPVFGIFIPVFII
jgi:hypothetical protein